MVPDHDPEMDMAIERARAEVSTFIERLAQPQVGDETFSVKAPIRDGDQVEHFWLNDVRHDGVERVQAVVLRGHSRHDLGSPRWSGCAHGGQGPSLRGGARRVAAKFTGGWELGKLRLCRRSAGSWAS